MIMKNFKDDFNTMVTNGIITPNKGMIRFKFRYASKLKGGIELLDLNVRAYNSLKRSGINTIEDIDKKWDDLSRLRNAGVKTVKEVKNKFIIYYYNSLDDNEKKQFWADTAKATIEM